MVTCCILYCNTCCGKSVCSKAFPKNENLRELWLRNINRHDWIPSATSRVCEMHFSPEMWETVENEKKLRDDAIPTIFPSPPVRKRFAGEIFIRSEKRKKQRMSSKLTLNCASEAKLGSGGSVPTHVLVLQPQEMEHFTSMFPSEAPIHADHVLDDFQNPADESPIARVPSADLKLEAEQNEQFTSKFQFEVPLQANLVLNDLQNPTDESPIASLPSTDAKLEEEQKERKLRDLHTTSSTDGASIAESTSNTAITMKNNELEKLFHKQQKLINNLKKRLRQIRKEKKELEKNQHTVYKTILNGLFTQDQILNVIRQQGAEKKPKPKKWSNSTIKKALRLKFTCGNTGYDELLRLGFPLPHRRTLSRKIEHIKFKPGISEEMFEFLEEKVAHFSNATDKECSVALDEVAIEGGQMFDPQTKEYIGDITLPPNSEDTVKHALVYMIRGTGLRWKQVIGYDFTGSGFDGTLLKPIILQIIAKAENIGLRVNSITSDMGSINQACWKAFRIAADNKNGIRNSVPHPHPHGDSNRRLYFFADVPHLLKNMVTTIVNNKKLYIPKDIQEAYNLPTNIVDSNHLVEMLRLQEDLVFTLTPNLKVEDVILAHNRNFQKMKVNRAKKILSPEVSAALYFVGDENSKPEYFTTAWFVGHIAKWFRLMTSRNLQSAISKFYPEKYEETISFLTEMVNLVSRIRVGEKGHFKPIQRGFMLSTNSVIELCDYLLEKRGFKFVLTSTFTQDCVENLFSIIRSKHVTPNVLQFKYDLRLIVISQYNKQIRSSNYEYDDSDFLTDFLQVKKSKVNIAGMEVSQKLATGFNCRQNDDQRSILYSELLAAENKAEKSQYGHHRKILESVQQSSIPQTSSLSPNLDLQDLSPVPVKSLNLLEENSLYRAAGYLIASIKKTMTSCEKCIESVGSKSFLDVPYARFVAYKEFKENTLFYVNEATFATFKCMENIFRSWHPVVKKYKNVNLNDFFIPRLLSVPHSHILTCHQLNKKIVRRFLLFRLRICNQAKAKEKEKVYDSKSMAMHTTFQ